MDTVHMGHSDGQISSAEVPSTEEGWTEQQRFYGLTHDDGVNRGAWVSHRHLSGDDVPAWVECVADSRIEQRLAAYWGCPIGRPAEIPDAPPSGETPADAPTEISGEPVA